MRLLKLSQGWLNLDAVSLAAPGKDETGKPGLALYLAGNPNPVTLFEEENINAVMAALRDLHAAQAISAAGAAYRAPDLSASHAALVAEVQGLRGACRAALTHLEVGEFEVESGLATKEVMALLREKLG